MMVGLKWFDRILVKPQLGVEQLCVQVNQHSGSRVVNKRVLDIMGWDVRDLVTCFVVQWKLFHYGHIGTTITK